MVEAERGNAVFWDVLDVNGFMPGIRDQVASQVIWMLRANVDKSQSWPFSVQPYLPLLFVLFVSTASLTWSLESTNVAFYTGHNLIAS